MENITVSERAARQIGRILQTEPPGTMLRVTVEGGGCSGFQYKFDMDRTREADDVVITRDNATVLIDPVSLAYLAGSEQSFHGFGEFALGGALGLGLRFFGEAARRVGISGLLLADVAALFD